MNIKYNVIIQKEENINNNFGGGSMSSKYSVLPHMHIVLKLIFSHFLPQYHKCVQINLIDLYLLHIYYYIHHMCQFY